MDKLLLLRYICENKLSFKYDPESLYNAQLEYIHKECPVVSFDPLHWVCSNAKDFFKKCKVVYTINNDITPCSVFYKHKCIFHNGIMKTKSLEYICEFYIDHMDNDNYDFNCVHYYKMYAEQIDLFDELYKRHNDSITNKITDTTRLFYIIHGYWKNLLLRPINGLQLIASNSSCIQKYNTNDTQALQDMLNTDFKLDFCAITYIASNIPKLSEYISKCSKCEVDKNRIYKHYIRNGHAEKLCTNKFDMWRYLANNYKRIKKILPKNSKGKTIWDIYYLTSSNVAHDFIKRQSKIKSNIFDDTKFVKEYIDNEYVNKSRKLSLENSAKYFVIYYVLSKQVRYDLSLSSKLVNFLMQRTTDTMRQVPLNATRFLIETKCL